MYRVFERLSLSFALSFRSFSSFRRLLSSSAVSVVTERAGISES